MTLRQTWDHAKEPLAPEGPGRTGSLPCRDQRPPERTANARRSTPVAERRSDALAPITGHPNRTMCSILSLQK